ncbi:MAG: Asp-tRNA(Asn)/Glu-tRNA(Gln) amidotransferase subunit GatC [Spirochaetota bacterium]|nr:Asp-tRNA(Asn)/Glu-tRNA(Gln) amidotransferase subunit GatC [Spirochaetota bacterium]
MGINQKEIIRVAELARLELTEDEKTEFSKQLSDIINYVNKVNELDTENIKPTDHIIDLKNVFRKDEVKDSIDVSEAERMAPRFKDGHIVTPIIVE